MELSPEQRRKIYEEEKSRIEAEGKQQDGKKAETGASTLNLEPNVAGLLCYLGLWISGIIFIVLEQKNQFVRFHAFQSIIVFGSLTIIAGVFQQIPWIGWFLNSVTGILMLILWILLMVKAHQSELYKIPLAGDLAEKISEQSWSQWEKPAETPVPPEQETKAESFQAATTILPVHKQPQKTVKDSKTGSSARTAASIFAIAWAIALLLFFVLFNRYIAVYQYEYGRWLSFPILTEGFNEWLPILSIMLAVTIVGHIILLIFDKYVLREIIMIIIGLLSIIVVASLVYLYPFNFSAIPSVTVIKIVQIVLPIVLLCIIIGLVVSVLVRFIRLLVNLVKRTPDY